MTKKEDNQNELCGEMDFPVGTIVGFHGLRGEMKVRPDTNNPDLLLPVKQMKVVSLGQAPFLAVIDTLRVEKRMLVLSFEGYEDRTSVEPFEGCELLCNRSELAGLDTDEFWLSDLVGLDVFTEGGSLIGKVRDIIYSGNDLLEIVPEGRGDGKTILVPFVHHIVPNVDLQKRRITVIDLPGLLDPQ